VNTKCELSLSLSPSAVPPSFQLYSKAQNASGKHLPYTHRHPLLYLSYSPSLSCCIKATLMTLEASRRTQGIVITKWQAHIRTHTHTRKNAFLCIPYFSFTVITDTERLDLLKRLRLGCTHQPRPHAEHRFRRHFWMSGKFTRNLLNLLLFYLSLRFYVR
jgi:hypothetical protein